MSLGQSFFLALSDSRPVAHSRCGRRNEGDNERELPPECIDVVTDGEEVVRLCVLQKTNAEKRRKYDSSKVRDLKTYRISPWMLSRSRGVEVMVLEWFRKAGMGSNSVSLSALCMRFVCSPNYKIGRAHV